VGSLVPLDSYVPGHPVDDDPSLLHFSLSFHSQRDPAAGHPVHQTPVGVGDHIVFSKRLKQPGQSPSTSTSTLPAFVSGKYGASPSSLSFTFALSSVGLKSLRGFPGREDRPLSVEHLQTNEIIHGKPGGQGLFSPLYSTLPALALSLVQLRFKNLDSEPLPPETPLRQTACVHRSAKQTLHQVGELLKHAKEVVKTLNKKFREQNGLAKGLTKARKQKMEHADPWIASRSHYISNDWSRCRSELRAGVDAVVSSAPSLAYLLSDPRATKPTLRFLADSGRFNSLYSPPPDDPTAAGTVLKIPKAQTLCQHDLFSNEDTEDSDTGPAASRLCRQFPPEHRSVQLDNILNYMEKETKSGMTRQVQNKARGFSEPSVSPRVRDIVHE
ncbi:hypothetical protein C6P46_003228, partial [Rhodotorula mucilaginosa]